MITDDLRVAIVVPSHRGGNALLQLLILLSEQSQSPDEVIVVESHITDVLRRKLQELAEEFEFPIRLLPNPRQSIPAALNIGIAAASSPVIVRLDVCAVPSSDYIERCVQVLLASGAAVTGGHWRFEAGEATPVASAIATAASHWLGGGGAAYRRQPPTKASDVDTVPYGCFRKALWKQLGGFNEDLLTNEDYEFNWRVRIVGERVRFDPSIVSIYHTRTTLRTLGKKYYRYGWWKAQMLRSYPRSLRWRQFAPALLLWGLLLPPIAAIYLLLITWAALISSNLFVGCALFTEHISWSLGFWSNILSGARWPSWRETLGVALATSTMAQVTTE